MIAVIRFPGSNCDEDTLHALSYVGAEARLVWHRETCLDDFEAVILPGGFSYGDYLRSGAVAANSPIMAAVADFAARGGPVLGICNGFQVLTECGLLPGALTRNARPHFMCRPSKVLVERDDLIFTGNYQRGEVLTLPVAHAEGRYFADAATLERLEARGGVVFRYCDATGEVAADGLNGSAASIAGVVNERGNVLGMMPHPERAVEVLVGGDDGAAMLTSLVEYLSSSTGTGPATVEA